MQDEEAGETATSCWVVIKEERSNGVRGWEREEGTVRRQRAA